MSKNNHHLGQFQLTGIPPAPKGTAQIEVTFEVDENSILTVSAVEKGTGQKQQITITNEEGRLSKDEIDQMIKDAEILIEEDQALRAKIEARNSFESYHYQMTRSIEDSDKLADKVEPEDKETIQQAL